MCTSRAVPKWLFHAAFAVVLCGMLALPAVGLSPGAEAGRSCAQPSPEMVVVTVMSRPSVSEAIPIAVRVGDQFSISLPSNHTTGFGWRIAEGMSSTVLKMAGSKYVAPSGGFVGRGGSEIWTFTALHKGNTAITLEYVRPWEKGVKPAKSQAFAVVVI